MNKNIQLYKIYQIKSTFWFSKLTLQLYVLSHLLTFLPHQVFAQGNPPNMLVIMADDLGYYDIGFNRIHAPDEPYYGIIPTPNIDRIAQSGVTCTRAYVAHPFCGPSRAALLTGRYPHEVNSQYNLPNGGKDCNGQDVGIPIGPDSDFFSKVLQEEANYTTYMVGKWHLGNAQQFDPISRGFTEYYGFLGGGHQYFPAGDPSQGINSSNQIAANQNNTGINDYFKYLEKNRQVIPDESRYVTRAISEEAVNFIKAGKQSSQPFLAYVAYNAPHTPLQAPLPDKDQFLLDNPNFLSNIENSPDILNSNNVINAATEAERQEIIAELIQDRITYATMVAIMDEGIGNILDELQSSDDGGSVFDNTIVIFLSDNGGKLREAGGVNYPLDRGKGSVNEGGFRVPMAISWPDGGVPANLLHNYPVSSLDIYPSLLAAANLAIPNRLDGENVLNDIKTTSPTLRNDPLYILRHYNGFSNVSIMDNIPGSEKKVIKKANGDWQYYDLASDITEMNNLNNGATVLEAETIIHRLVPKVRILAEQHLQPLFFDKCNVGENWVNNNMPRFKDASNRPEADTPDETFYFDCYANLTDSDNDGVCDELDLCPGGEDAIDANANGIPDFCDACVDVQLNVLLEGTYNTAIDAMETALNTQHGILPGQTPVSLLITPTPQGQPYNNPPWNYVGGEGSDWTDINYSSDVVDWLLVSFRTGEEKNTEISQVAALLTKSGSVDFPTCALLNQGIDSVYVVVEHRNHMGIMSPQKVAILNGILSFDFSLADSYRDATSFGQKQMGAKWGMYAGDGDQSDFPSYDIQGTDKSLWLESNGTFSSYDIRDFNLDGDVNGADKALWDANNGVSSRVPK